VSNGLTKQELVKQLRDAGYTGPVSGTRGWLLGLVAEHCKSSDVDLPVTVVPDVDTSDQPVSTPPAAGDEDWDSGTQILAQWQGLTAGDKVRLSTDKPTSRRYYEFIHHFTGPTQTYVTVKDLRTGNLRPVHPDFILDKDTRQKVVDR
jgi:hypothetical protein